MIFLEYLIKIFFFAIIRLLTFPLAPIAVAFQKDNHLRFPFKWMDCIDNDLTGDVGWKDEHCHWNYDNYCCRVKWMWRNGGDWIAYYTFGKSYLADTYWNCGKYPLWGKNLEWRLGWDTQDEKQGRCKINLSVRWR